MASDDGLAKAVDASAVFVTLKEPDSSGVLREVEYRARALGVRDFIELQAWMKRRVIQNALAVIRDEKIEDPIVVKSIMDHANEEASTINILLFEDEVTARAFNDPETWTRFVYYSLRREHPDITLEKAFEIVDKVPDPLALVESIQRATAPELTETQKKASAADGAARRAKAKPTKTPTEDSASSTQGSP